MVKANMLNSANTPVRLVSHGQLPLQFLTATAKRYLTNHAELNVYRGVSQ